MVMTLTLAILVKSMWRRKTTLIRNVTGTDTLHLDFLSRQAPLNITPHLQPGGCIHHFVRPSDSQGQACEPSIWLEGPHLKGVCGEMSRLVVFILVLSNAPAHCLPILWCTIIFPSEEKWFSLCMGMGYLSVCVCVCMCVCVCVQGGSVGVVFLLEMSIPAS